MNGRITAIGFALLLSVSVVAGAGVAETQDSETPTVAAGSDQVSSGSQASVGITLDEAPDGIQTYQVTVELANPQVANITGARPGEIRGDGFSVVSQSSSSITLRGADFANSVQSGATRVDLGTVLLNETFGGETEVSVTVDTLRDDNSSVVDASTESGNLIISGGTPRPTRTATPTPTPTPTQTTTATPTPTPATTTVAVDDTPTDTTAADDGASGDTPTAPENTIPPADGNDGGDGDGSEETATTTTETSSGGGPGFTAGLTVLAVAGVALLARRRD